MDLNHAIVNNWQHFVAQRRDGALICANTVSMNPNPYVDRWMAMTVLVASAAFCEFPEPPYIGTLRIKQIAKAVTYLRENGMLSKNSTSPSVWRLLVLCTVTDPALFLGFGTPVDL